MVRRMLSTTAVFDALAFAQPALAAETYVFDKAHTNIQFSWDHFGFSTTSAGFEEFSGELQFDPEDRANSSIEVTIDLDSVDSGFDTFNEHLTEKPEWFNTDEYPEATFTSTGIEALGEDRLRVTGDLTLKGVTKEITLETTINKIGKHPVSNAKTIGFDATTTVSRSAFDMGQYAPSVGDEVTISISSEMQRESDL
jgi:polyisoprenoid-binding protein YceI